MMQSEHILISHGSGGRLSRELIRELFLKYFGNADLNRLVDASAISLASADIAYTTDSYVVEPPFFSGGNIGKLAVCGTVNDLSVSGAIPRYLSCGFILEEGFSMASLESVVQTMAEEASKAGVQIVTGDTKVVKRGQADGIFINTSGIGELPAERMHLNDPSLIGEGDKIIVSGHLGDHAITILAARENLQLDDDIRSDAASLHELCAIILQNPSDVRTIRDITRGGLATVVNEICEGTSFGIEIEEKRIPVRSSVRSVCDLYGFDPLYLANEGKLLCVVKAEAAEDILGRMRRHPLGAEAAIIGHINTENPGRVVMRSVIGGKRIVDMLSGEMLPRIC